MNQTNTGCTYCAAHVEHARSWGCANLIHWPEGVPEQPPCFENDQQARGAALRLIEKQNPQEK